jgi:hypothetical protein
LIADNSANPELIAFGTIINPYFSPLAVPETVLAITDRLAIRVYVNNSGRTITLHTENSHLCQIITTFTTGLTTLNGLTKQVQYLATGTSGSDFNISSATATHTFNLPTASAVNRGALSAADWAVFNGKQNAITLTTTGTSGVSTLIGSTLNIPNYSTDLSGYVTLATDQTITGLKTILRGGDVLNFKIGTDTIYGLKVAYNQNELVPSGEATWSFVNTFNRNGSGFSVTPLSFFRGVLVTGERLLSASVNTNLLDYYANNPTGRYPIYAYNTGVQQFASSIIVGETNGVVDAITGSIADLPAGVVANFKGRVIGSNAVNNNEFATLGQVTSTSRAAISLTTTGTSGPATYSSVTGVLNIPEYQGGVTSFNTRTGAVTLTSSDVTTALGYTPVTDARTLSINGVTYDLTANRSWTVGVNPSAREIQTYIATSLQTTFTVTGGYTVGLVDVFINGVRLTSSDYTATNGTTVVLTVGTMAGNIVDIIKYTSGIVNSISGSGTTNELAYFTASTTIASLSTATYPSLTELSYVKGVTSSIQTQLNGKQNTLTNPVTGTGASGQVAYWSSSSAITGESNLFWDGTNDRLGVGTGTPSNTLTIKNNNPATSGIDFQSFASLSVQGKIVFDQGDDTFNFTNTSAFAAGGIVFKTNSTTKFQIFTDGNTFIGTSPTNAGFKLQVNGEGRFYQPATTSTAYLRVENNRSRNAALRLTTTVGDYLLGVGIGADVNQFQIYDNTAGSTRLTIANTGAATFNLGSGEMRLNRTGTSEYLKLNTYYLLTDGNDQLLGSVTGATNIYAGNGVSPRLTITSGGNVLIGTTTDNGDRMNISGAVSISSNLGVGRGSESGVRLSISGAGTSNAAYVIIARDSLGNDLLYVRNDGYTNTGSRASSPYNLTSGNAANMVVGADGTLYRSTSSLKYKTDVKDYDKGLSEVLKMRSVYYKGKNDGDTQFAGLIAEEIHELGLTEFVQYAPDGTPDALAYSNMVALLVKGMQELKAELDELKSKN